MVRSRRSGAKTSPDQEETIISRATPACLQQLIEDGLIDAIVCPLKSGKEADLFVVECDPYHYVAKVYKERQARNFKNDAVYREGRRIRDTRAQRALTKNTGFGRKLAEQNWHLAEVDALRRLSAAGARVPRVLAHHDRVLIMELICDSRGQLAPQLAQVPLSREGALEMYDTILGQVVLMLMNDLVHGDLSPYNVLIREDGPVIIDLPQCVSAPHNTQAGNMLERDVMAVARYLGTIEPSIRQLGREAWQLWVEYERGTLTEDFRPVLGKERPNQIDDLDDLVGFVKAANEEAELERRAAEGDADARALLKAAERRAAKQARRAEEARRAAAEAEAEARRKAAAEARKAAGQDGERRGDDEGGGGKRRRRRGRGRGDGGPRNDGGPRGDDRPRRDRSRGGDGPRQRDGGARDARRDGGPRGDRPPRGERRPSDGPSRGERARSERGDGQPSGAGGGGRRRRRRRGRSGPPAGSS